MGVVNQRASPCSLILNGAPNEIAALVAFAVLWPGTRWQLMLMALTWSMPAVLLLLYGQDSAFWLLFVAAGLLFIGRNRPWSAGVAFSLCICKFHLALAIPIFLVAQKRWKTMIASAIGTMVLLASCFLIEGPRWPLLYLQMSHMAGFSPAAFKMANLLGVAYWFPWTAAVDAALSGALALLLWVASRGNNDLGAAGAAVAAGGLLLSPHSYANDLVLLIPLAVLTIQHPALPSWLKGWAVLLLSPAPVLLLVSQRPWLGQVLIVGFVVTAIIAATANPRQPTAAGDSPGYL